MHSHSIERVDPLHPHPASVINRYFDTVMSLTYKHPTLMTVLVDAIGIGGLLIALSPWAPLGRTVSVLAGTATAGFAYATHFSQHKLFGMPVAEVSRVYSPDAFKYGGAKGEIIIKAGYMPRLRIVSNNHFEAGFVEGYLLGAAIKSNIEKTAFLYPVMCLLLGAPVDTDKLEGYLSPVLNKIPADYRQEMFGKVEGYNHWLAINHPNEKPLSYHRYVLYQLMPDLHNYNPFDDNKLTSRMPSMPRIFGCTTIAVRLGNFTFLARVLDWPSHGEGKYFLQVDRSIAGKNRTIDVGLPMLSGALTVLNRHGRLFEMNIAYGDKSVSPQGMPAVFVNRLVAESADNVADARRVLQEIQPLSAYHLTMSDGEQTESFHFYQSKEVVGQHVIEDLSDDKTTPQLMVVANHGLRYGKVVNHKDSTERKANVNQLFSQSDSQAMLQQFIDLQRREIPSRDDVLQVKKFMLELTRVALVSNCESVLCEMLVYLGDKLEDVSVVTDNLYAQQHNLEEFSQLSNPRLM